MNTEQTQDVWFVESDDGVMETTLPELGLLIADGSLTRSNRVRKGNLRWIEAGKVPPLVPYFQNGVSRPAEVSVNSAAAIAAPDVRDVRETSPGSGSVPSAADKHPNCSVHIDYPAVYICDTCANFFCKSCPEGLSQLSKQCPFCGASCNVIATARDEVVLPSVAEKRDPIDHVQTESPRPPRQQSAPFGFADLIAALAYPFRFKASLIMGALMFMVLSVAQGAASFGGAAMFSGAIFCFMLANTISFGILANTIDNFSQGKLNENFMPTFDDFSAWDDVIQPFALTIGIYVVSFGPLAAVILTSLLNSGSAPVTSIPSSHAQSQQQVAGQFTQQNIDQTKELREALKDISKSERSRVEALQSQNEGAAQTGPPENTALTAEKDLQKTAATRPTVFDPQPGGPASRTVATEVDDTSPAVHEAGPENSNLVLPWFSGKGIVFVLLIALAVVWGLVYFPAASAVAGYTRSLAATLNPIVGIDTIKRLGIDYLKVLLMVGAIALISAAVSALLQLLLRPFDMPWVGNVPARALGSLFTFYFSVVFACVLGFALSKAGDRLGLYR